MHVGYPADRENDRRTSAMMHGAEVLGVAQDDTAVVCLERRDALQAARAKAGRRVSAGRERAVVVDDERRDRATGGFQRVEEAGLDVIEIDRRCTGAHVARLAARVQGGQMTRVVDAKTGDEVAACVR